MTNPMFDDATNTQEQESGRVSKEYIFDCGAQESVPGKEPYFWELRAGDRDPLANVKLKTVQAKSQSFIVYIDEANNLQWAWFGELDQRKSAPIFNRINELEAKADFLRETKQDNSLFFAKILIGEGLVRFFLTHDPDIPSEALDTAEKFISQKAKRDEPGLVFFALLLVLLHLRDNGSRLMSLERRPHHKVSNRLYVRWWRWGLHLQRYSQ